ncbi:MAG: hypothetical protein E4H08_07580 [Candidatus Atribacteria bacterium]|nr:MAG: hypothetical protein E4H08_07580 [Candidatus Atribacteria bacterium]
MIRVTWLTYLCSITLLVFPTTVIAASDCHEVLTDGSIVEWTSTPGIGDSADANSLSFDEEGHPMIPLHKGATVEITAFLEGFPFEDFSSLQIEVSSGVSIDLSFVVTSRDPRSRYRGATLSEAMHINGIESSERIAVDFDSFSEDAFAGYGNPIDASFWSHANSVSIHVAASADGKLTVHSLRFCPTESEELSPAGDSSIEVGQTPNLSATPQAIEIINQQAYIVDWSSGELLSVDLATGDVRELGDNFDYVTDIASIGEDLLIINESREAWIVDTDSGEPTDYSIDAQFSGEVLGVAHYENILCLLVYGSTGPSILALQSGQSTQTPIQAGTVGELISLQMWNGSLLTLDYQAGIAFRLVGTGTSYTLEQAFDITDYVPAAEQASAGVRGFFLTDDTYYFTSVSYNSEPGKLHIVPVATDPLAVSLQDWDATDFGTHSGARETVRYGEDDHGSYLAFTNPSSTNNVVLQLWLESSDYDLSSATGFFVDAMSLGEPTDMFVEFIHDDASSPDGAIFMNNESDAFTLAESGVLTIGLDDLACSEATEFPWSDVDGVMLHFRPSDAEIRFYGFCSTIQTAFQMSEAEK